MTLVNLAALTAALAERDAARAEVARLRAAVEGVLDPMGDPLDPKFLHPQAASLMLDIRKALAATEDQP